MSHPTPSSWSETTKNPSDDKNEHLGKLIREPYLLRHTFCTDCQAAGVPLNVAKELMGHSDISVTAKIYTHMVDEVFEQNRKRLAEYANQKEQKAVNE